MLFADEQSEGVLLDAGNAFSRLNCRVALHNVGILCPAIGNIHNIQTYITLRRRKKASPHLNDLLVLEAQRNQDSEEDRQTET